MANGSDFKIILGNEIHLVDSLEEVRDNYKGKETKFFHFIQNSEEPAPPKHHFPPIL